VPTPGMPIAERGAPRQAEMQDAEEVSELTD
jgi:hypothetical protein